jgi:hypothetical protein
MPVIAIEKSNIFLSGFLLLKSSACFVFTICSKPSQEGGELAV